MYEIIIREVTVDGIPGVEPMITEHFKQRFDFLYVPAMVRKINAEDDASKWFPFHQPHTPPEPFIVTCGGAIGGPEYQGAGK